MNNFSRRVLDLQSLSIKEIAAAVKKDPQIISLAQGLPSFSTPKHIRQAVASSLLKDEQGIGAYSLYSGTRELKRAIAKKLTGEFSEVEPLRGSTSKPLVDADKEIFVTVGAMEGLATCILAIVNPGDEVILPTPDYPPHEVQVRLTGAKPIFVPLREKLQTGHARASQICNFWTWDLRDLKKVISGRTKLIILTNPGNPTGGVFDYKLLEGIVNLAKKHDLWVLADETYAFLTYDGVPFISLGLFRRQLGEVEPHRGSTSKYDKLIVIRSFSKEYAMTGWRLGYVYAPAELVKQALKVHDALVGCPSTISQKGALAALTGPQDCVEEFRKELTYRWELMGRLLDELSDYFEYTKPAGAYYFWLKIKEQKEKSKDTQQNSKINSLEFARRLLTEGKVAVVPGAAFGPNGERYIRMCFAVSREEIKEAFLRIKKWLHG